MKRIKINFTRWVFSINLALGFLWLLYFMIKPVVHNKYSSLLIISGGLFLSAAISYLLFKHIPNFLEKNNAHAASILKYYVISSIISYFALIPFFASLVVLQTLCLRILHGKDFITFIIIFSLWMPFWWFIPAGLILGWFAYQKMMHKDPQQRTPPNHKE